MSDMIQALLGCSWGRRGGISSRDDVEPCLERAAQIVVIHHGADEVEVRLCERHRDRVLSETTPHVDDVPNPGSRAAREAGCRCAVMDNNHGTRAPFGDDGWWINDGCPVHARAEP